MHATLCVPLAETVQQLCRVVVVVVWQGDVPNSFFRLSQVQHQLASKDTLRQILATPACQCQGWAYEMFMIQEL